MSKSILCTFNCFKYFLFVALFFTACEEEIVNPLISDKNISFSVSAVDCYKTNSRTLQSKNERKIRGNGLSVSVSVEDNVTLLDFPVSRGTQITESSVLQEFDVVAFHYEEGTEKAIDFFTEKVVDGVHTSGLMYYWPMKGTLDFIAVSPIDAVSSMPLSNEYNQGYISFSYEIPEVVSNQKDVMVAVTKGVNNVDNGGPVPLVFEHLLSSVQFKVGEMQFIKINSIEISGIYGGVTTFTYDKESNTWTCSGSTDKVTYSPDIIDTSGLPKGEEITGNDLNSMMFILPQTAPEGATVTVDYTELLTGITKKGSVSIEREKWDAGKTYAYSLNIGATFDVTIPTPENQDAHYIMLEMPYRMGALSNIVTSVQATASFLEDGSNTSSKSGISLLFKEQMSVTQKLGFWTDERYIEEQTVKDDGTIVSSGIYKDADIRGTNKLLISGNALKEGVIVLFIEENNGKTNRNGELILQATLQNGTEIVIGRGNFKQLCPSWNGDYSGSIGVERIEDDDEYPFGFSYSRRVVFSNPGNDAFWLIKGIAQLLYSWGASGAVVDDDGDFITVTRKETTLLKWTYIDNITLNYGALNKVASVAGQEDGLVNTSALYHFTGGNNLSQIETDLIDNLRWDREVSTVGSVPDDYAAFIALSRNRMYEMMTITKADDQEDIISYRPILHRDINGDDIIEWYLPSSVEARALKESDTGSGSNGVSPLNGTYWSSTAGNDANSFAHSYTYINNVFSKINVEESRMNEWKVRAVRKKP